MRSVSLACLAAAGMVIACRPPAPRFSEADAAAVRAVFDSVEADIRLGKWDAYADHFTRDVKFFGEGGAPIFGRTALLEMVKAQPPMDSIEFGPAQAEALGDLAWGWSSVMMAARGAPVARAYQVVVLRRQLDGSWLVCSVSVTSRAPTQAPGSRS